ncbi:MULTISPECIES: HdeD family acid-resistance protein [Microbacterium]|uniref:HdeD family acid-resistance protein n=1 Tax=Microbacterium TaxID=33882 RepID=UPI001E4CCEF4|nr:DUF308 domain-containing protein [Microbacterium nymphoidis]MCD2497364.1 DUF308 domain-containing protein [Microbacterium nymphoidis]
MSDNTLSDRVQSTAKRVRLWLGIGGALALITGIIMLVWPGSAVVAVTMVLAFYTLLTGIVYAVIGFTAPLAGVWSRIGHVLVGVLFIVAAIVAFANPSTTSVIVGVMVVTFIAIAWIFEGAAALASLNLSPSKGWTVFYAIVSILGGIALLFSPLIGLQVIVLWIAITLIVMGIVQIVRAFTLGRG